MPSLEDALALKQKGNKAFADHDWLTAVDFYSQAIEANDKDPSFYCNRAQVQKAFLSALMDVGLTLFSRPTSRSNRMVTQSLMHQKLSNLILAMSK